MRAEVDDARHVDVPAPVGPNPITTTGTLTVRDLGPDVPPASDLATVLASVPGANVRRLGGLGDVAVVSLRGSSLRQVELFLDGVPLNPDGAEVVDLSELPPSAFSRVEVWRGDAPARYGAAPLGGVIDLRTPPPSATPTAVGIAAGSWSTLRGHAVTGGPLGEHADAYVAGDVLGTAGDFTFLDDAGTIYNRLDDGMPRRLNNDIFRANGLARVNVGRHGARFTLLDAAAHVDRGLPGPVGARAERARYAATRNLLSASADLTAGDSLRVVPRTWWFTRSDELDDRLGELGVGGEWRRDRTDTVGAQVDATWAPRSWGQVGVLARARRDTYRPYDAIAEVTDGERRRDALVAALSGEARVWGDRVLVTPVVQVNARDDRSLGDTPFADTAAEGTPRSTALDILPRGGVLVRPWPTLAVKGNVGRYVRPPDLFELFGQGGREMGNARLLPETGTHWDVALRGVRSLGEQSDRVAWACLAIDLGWSEVYAQDRIVRVQNSQQTTLPVNLPSARIRTLEAGAEMDVLDTLRSRTSVTRNLAENLDPDPAYTGNALPRLPALELEQTTSVHLDASLELSHTWSHAGATFLDAANVLVNGPRNLHALALRARAPRGLAVSAEVRNLFDVRAVAVDRNPLSTTDDTLVAQPLADFGGYPLPGRTVMVAVSWSGAPPTEPP